jgi:hypothetical protein
VNLLPDGGRTPVAPISGDEGVSSAAHAQDEAPRGGSRTADMPPRREDIDRLPSGMQDRTADFAAEDRDPLWAATTEGQILGALPQSSVALIDWHVECRTSVCMVRYRHPAGIDSEALRRDDQRLFSVVTNASSLLGGRVVLTANEDGTLSGVMDLHRRCASDWECLGDTRVPE